MVLDVRTIPPATKSSLAYPQAPGVAVTVAVRLMPHTSHPLPHVPRLVASPVRTDCQLVQGPTQQNWLDLQASFSTAKGRRTCLLEE